MNTRFFLAIKPSNDIQHISARKDADSRMCERMENVFDKINIDMLYGINALGSKLCLYLVQVIDTAPVGRWGIGILDPGEKRVREVVAT